MFSRASVVNGYRRRRVSVAGDAIPTRPDEASVISRSRQLSHSTRFHFLLVNLIQHHQVSRSSISSEPWAALLVLPAETECYTKPPSSAAQKSRRSLPHVHCQGGRHYTHDPSSAPRNFSNYLPDQCPISRQPRFGSRSPTCHVRDAMSVTCC